MNGKSLVLLVLAVLSGLGAMYGTSRLLSKNQRQAASEMQDVLVAARDLKVEEVLKPDLVKVVQMSRASLPPGTFTSFKDVEDRWVQIKTLEGEPILDRKLAPKGSPAGLVSRIPKGMRAFAIEVNEQTGVSGFILPDHRVDVVQINPARSSKSEAETILQDVLVLASGQVFTRPEDRSIQCADRDAGGDPRAGRHPGRRPSPRGPLTLSLRGLNDHDAGRSPSQARARQAAGHGRGPARAAASAAAAARRRCPRRPPRSTTCRSIEGTTTSNRIQLDEPATLDEAPQQDEFQPDRP